MSASLAQAGRIAPELTQEMAAVSSGELLPIYVVVRGQVDYSRITAQAVAMDRVTQRAFAVHSLREATSRMQSTTLDLLRQLEAEGEVTLVHAMWSVPMISAEASSEAIARLAAHPDVEVVQTDKPVEMLAGAPQAAEPASPGPGAAPAALAWSINWVNAPAVWALGYRGQGVIASVHDTGVWYNHTDLADHIWTNDDPWNGVDDDGNGYVDDLHGYNFNAHSRDPIDQHGHGTHCSGTVLGDGTAGTQTGMAPDATLMCLRVLSSGGSGNPSDVVESVEYAIDNGSQVGSFSIGWWSPDTFTRQLYRNMGEAAIAAGFPLIVAAGNERGFSPFPPNQLRSPGDVPAPWRHPAQTAVGTVGGVITVAATGYFSDNFASFSSQGPTQWSSISPWFDWAFSPGSIKPDIAAPGTNVNSTVLGGGYSGDSWSGTSMATPHVAGLVALMLSKNPDLTPAQIDQILEENALDRGPAGKDNDYGSGRIQPLQTLNATPDPGPDVLAPAAVTNLAAVPAPGVGRIRLNWTAPGDDGAVGTADSYEVKYHPAGLGPIDTEGEWAAASNPVAPEPDPQSGGTSETWMFGALALGKQYWFSIRARDEAGNLGGLSNSALGRASGQAPGTGQADPVGGDLAAGGASELSLATGRTGDVTSVMLAQNRPNPVLGGSTTISFALPQADHVTIRVFGVDGRLVRTLADAEFAAGTHQTTWDGRDASGHGMPNGVYFYSMQTSSETLTRKLALTR